MDQVRRALRNFLLDIALNALVPVVLYRLSKVFLSPSEFTALIAAMTFPMARSLFGLARDRRLDPVSVIVLLGLGASAIAVVFGAGPRILLIRESFFTAVFGVACFVSLLLRRPMMFYFGRHFLGGVNPLKVRRYEMSWQLPEVRRVNRLITMVWGSVFLGEFVIRVILFIRCRCHRCWWRHRSCWAR